MAWRQFAASSSSVVDVDAVDIGGTLRGAMVGCEQRVC